MNEVKKETEKIEILRAIKDSIEDARYTVREMAQVFTDSVQSLRLEESENVFTGLAQNIQDLQCLMEFLRELKEGMSFFDGFGLPSDPISSKNFCIDLFKDMQSAFEIKDWIMLSDLIEYELSPLLVKEDEWLGILDQKLLEYEA